LLDGPVFVAEVWVNGPSRLRVHVLAGELSMADDKKVRIWDLPVRLFHWTLVVLLVVSYCSGQAGGDWMKLHFFSGCTILILLLFRIIWGFVGSTTARFSHFVTGPGAWFVYLKSFVTGRKTYDVGHNPVGGIMVVVLIFAVLAQAVAGLFSADTDMGTVNGPLANTIPDKWVDRATAFHEFWVNVIIGLAVLHILAAVTYLVLKRQNLIGAMFTGRKPLAHVAEPGQPAPSLSFGSAWIAISLLLVFAATVYLCIWPGWRAAVALLGG
jgi:cytochrome b